MAKSSTNPRQSLFVAFDQLLRSCLCPSASCPASPLFATRIQNRPCSLLPRWLPRTTLADEIVALTCAFDRGGARSAGAHHLHRRSYKFADARTRAQVSDPRV